MIDQTSGSPRKPPKIQRYSKSMIFHDPQQTWPLFASVPSSKHPDPAVSALQLQFSTGCWTLPHSTIRIYPLASCPASFLQEHPGSLRFAWISYHLLLQEATLVLARQWQVTEDAVNCMSKLSFAPIHHVISSEWIPTVQIEFLPSWFPRYCFLNLKPESSSCLKWSFWNDFP